MDSPSFMDSPMKSTIKVMKIDVLDDKKTVKFHLKKKTTIKKKILKKKKKRNSF